MKVCCKPILSCFLFFYHYFEYPSLFCLIAAWWSLSQYLHMDVHRVSSKYIPMSKGPLLEPTSAFPNLSNPLVTIFSIELKP